MCDHRRAGESRGELQLLAFPLELLGMGLGGKSGQQKNNSNKIKEKARHTHRATQVACVPNPPCEFKSESLPPPPFTIQSIYEIRNSGEFGDGEGVVIVILDSEVEFRDASLICLLGDF